MTNEFLHFEKINRETWQSLHRKTTPPLTEEELDSIKSFNDQISLQDVTDIYLPLAHLIQIYKRSKEDLAFSKGIFLQRESKEQPFIIGVSGSVAVGKSTTSRLLQILLSRIVPGASVELVTTDGFLYPNSVLIEQDILNRKGFPESYDMEALLNFLDQLKNGQDVTLEDGTQIIAADYISAPRPGKVITILGDTRKTNASVRLAVNADVLVHESTYGKGDEKIARKHGHSTNMQAAEVAREAGAKRLLLNHISARFLSKDVSQLRKDASSIFENVYVVKDLEEVEI